MVIKRRSLAPDRFFSANPIGTLAKANAKKLQETIAKNNTVKTEAVVPELEAVDVDAVAIKEDDSVSSEEIEVPELEAADVDAAEVEVNYEQLKISLSFNTFTIKNFKVSSSGLSYIEYKEKIKAITNSYVRVTGVGCDSNSDYWSIQLEWQTPDDQIKSRLIPLARIIGDSTLKNELINAGLILNPNCHRLFCDYLIVAANSSKTPKIKVIRQMGFFTHTNEKIGFMLPNAPILPEGVDTNTVKMVFQPPFSAPSHKAYGTLGSLKKWKEKLELASGNVLIVFASCAGFAAPMLEIAKAENVCFHVYGGTSRGKSTSAQVFASIFGCAVNSQQSAKPTLFLNWTATSNGIENLLVAHSGNGLVLDEIGGMPAGIQLNVYSMAQGMSKGRMNEFGSMREQYSWRTLTYSTGELSISEKIQQDDSKRKAKGGELIRALEIPIDELPVDKSLSNEESSKLADNLRKFLGENYGHAGVTFIKFILTFEKLPKLEALFNADVEIFHKNLCNTLSTIRSLSSEHIRALRHFAIVQTAGDWAVQAGASPFTHEQVNFAITTVAQTWLENFHLSEKELLIAKMRSFVLGKKSEIVNSENASKDPYSSTAKPKPSLFLHKDKIFMSPKLFEIACEGMTVKKAQALLSDMNLLHSQKGENYKVKVPIWSEIFGVERYYSFITVKMFSEEEIIELSEIKAPATSVTPIRRNVTLASSNLSNRSVATKKTI